MVECPLWGTDGRSGRVLVAPEDGELQRASARIISHWRSVLSSFLETFEKQRVIETLMSCLRVGVSPIISALRAHSANLSEGLFALRWDHPHVSV